MKVEVALKRKDSLTDYNKRLEKSLAGVKADNNCTGWDRDRHIEMLTNQLNINKKRLEKIESFLTDL